MRNYGLSTWISYALNCKIRNLDDFGSSVFVEGAFRWSKTSEGFYFWESVDMAWKEEI